MNQQFPQLAEACHPAMLTDTESRAFLSTLTTKGDMEHLTQAMQQTIGAEFRMVKDLLHSLTTQVNAFGDWSYLIEATVCSLKNHHTQAAFIYSEPPPGQLRE